MYNHTCMYTCMNMHMRTHSHVHSYSRMHMCLLILVSRVARTLICARSPSRHSPSNAVPLQGMHRFPLQRHRVQGVGGCWPMHRQPEFHGARVRSPFRRPIRIPFSWVPPHARTSPHTLAALVPPHPHTSPHTPYRSGCASSIGYRREARRPEVFPRRLPKMAGVPSRVAFARLSAAICTNRARDGSRPERWCFPVGWGLGGGYAHPPPTCFVISCPISPTPSTRVHSLPRPPIHSTQSAPLTPCAPTHPRQPTHAYPPRKLNTTHLSTPTHPRQPTPQAQHHTSDPACYKPCARHSHSNGLGSLCAQCEENPNFMAKQCPSSCGICHDLETSDKDEL